jgi:hypothetical protein
MNLDYLTYSKTCYYISLIFPAISPCSSNPCVHGTCHQNSNSFHCTCSSGYIGALCDKRISFELRSLMDPSKPDIFRLFSFFIKSTDRQIVYEEIQTV